MSDRLRLGRHHRDTVYLQLGDEPRTSDPRVAVFMGPDAVDLAVEFVAVANRTDDRVDELARDLEGERQESGSLRARIGELEPVLRRIADEGAEAVVDQGDVLFEVRELLGLDGRTGGCPSHRSHPHGGATCLDCPACRPAVSA